MLTDMGSADSECHLVLFIAELRYGHKTYNLQPNTPVQSKMFFIVFMIALFRTFGTSMPINIITPRDEPQPMASTPTYRLRTRFDIIWSCIATLFICTWIAIHPNVPPRGEGHIRSFWRRLRLMLWMLVVPELILIWAYKQWVAARYVAEIFKGMHNTYTFGEDAKKP